MNNLKFKLILSILMCWLGAISTTAQTTTAQTTKPTNAVKGKYQSIEIVAFDIQPGVEFPPDSLKVMMPEIIDEVRKLNKFKQVTSEGDAKTDASGASVRLTGTVSKYKPGNRAARYMVGFGAGAAKVVAHIKFTDSSTNEVLYEKDVDGKVIIGLFGGNSNGATRGLAKEVAKVTEKKFF